MYAISFTPDNPVFYLFILFGIVLFIQLIYYWGIFGHLAFFREKDRTKGDCIPVSVVVCAKNEYTNLKKHLPLLLEQDHPNFEVVVVDDGSDDDSDYLLKDFSEKYPHLKIINFKKNVNFFSGKKFPLAIGIKSAMHENLVLTDADCCPTSSQWLRYMQSAYTDSSVEVVLGYSPVVYKPTFLNYIIRFETFFTAVQYLSMALIGLPYMGVGRNLSYKRSLFIKNKGFSSHYHILSGDDDIFISQVAHKGNVRIVTNKVAQVFTYGKETLADWIKQKRRHYTTYPYYKRSSKVMLALFSASQFMFYVLFICLILLKYNILVVVSLLILRLISQLFIFKKCTNKLSERKLLLFSPIIEMLLTILQPLLAFTNLFSRRKKWN